MTSAHFIPLEDLAPRATPRGLAQEATLLRSGWFFCAWSRAYWPPDTHDAQPTTSTTTVQTLRAQLGLVTLETT